MRSKTIVLLAISLLPSAAAAQHVAAGGVADLGGPRSLGIGGAIGIASGNDGIYVNPAALAARRRYSAETQLWTERRGAESTAQVWTASVADSLSPLAAGVAYGRVTDGIETGSLYHLALAGSISQGMYFGVTGKYFDLGGANAVTAATVDAGLFWEVADYVAVGAAGYNLAPTGHEAELPRGVGAGLSLGSDTSFKVSFEWRADLQRGEKTTNRYAAGAEVLLGNVAPLRASYLIDETLDTKWWSIGVGLVSSNGGGLDVAYRQSVDDPAARTVAIALKLQFAQ